jgi:PIN domain nuclease of toxin-antitoxin system
MKLLLDTHTFLWHSNGSGSQISASATSLLADPANDLCLSIASVWEIAIKVGLKKLSLSGTLAGFLATSVAGYGLTVLPITLDDCIAYQTLPFPLPRHRDPFDRMIIVQAMRSGIGIVSADQEFDAYGATRLW